MDCGICCKSVKNIIQCDNCEQYMCKKCIENWLNERTKITCCICNTEWSYMTSFNKLGCFFMTKFKAIQKETLLNIEKSYIGDSQEFLKVEKMLEQVKLEIKNYIFDFDNTKNNDYNYYSYLTIRRDLLTQALNDADLTILKEDINFQSTKNFICNCVNENCKGLIYDNDFLCGICNIEICKVCQLELKDNHICDQNVVKTITSLNKDTKPCPKCLTRIFKIDGCNQMYCTNCLTAFDWVTLKIERGIIHNPHYFEILRRDGVAIPRNPNDNPDFCQMRIGNFNLLYYHPKYINKKFDFNDYLFNKEYINIVYVVNKIVMIFYLILVKAEIQYGHNHQIITMIEENTNYDFKTNFKHRLEFMKNNIDEKKFCTLIYKKYKLNSYYKDYKNEASTYDEVCKYLLLTIQNELKEFMNFVIKQMGKYFTRKTNNFLKTKDFEICIEIFLDKINNIYQLFQSYIKNTKEFKHNLTCISDCYEYVVPKNLNFIDLELEMENYKETFLNYNKETNEIIKSFKI